MSCNLHLLTSTLELLKILQTTTESLFSVYASPTMHYNASPRKLKLLSKGKVHRFHMVLLDIFSLSSMILLTTMTSVSASLCQCDLGQHFPFLPSLNQLLAESEISEIVRASSRRVAAVVGHFCKSFCFKRKAACRSPQIRFRCCSSLLNFITRSHYILIHA